VDSATLPERTLLTPLDLELLGVLGLKNCRDLDVCEKIMNSLRMRDLDRLKMIFSRIAKEDSIFSPEIEEGIRKNNLLSFAKAILLLNNTRLENAN
jgi:hypothetical protein